MFPEEPEVVYLDLVLQRSKRLHSLFRNRRTIRLISMGYNQSEMEPFIIHVVQMKRYTTHVLHTRTCRSGCNQKNNRHGASY